MELVQKVQLIVEAALEAKAERPIALDVREVSSFADGFVILGGRSDRQVRAIADRIRRVLKERGDAPLGVEGYNDGRWVLMDCNDVVVHVFGPEAREYYDLERLWSDAEPLDVPGIETDAPPRLSSA